MLVLPKPTSAYVVALALGLEDQANQWATQQAKDSQARLQIWPLLQDQLITLGQATAQEGELRQYLRRLAGEQALGRERQVGLLREIASFDRRLVGLRKNLQEADDEQVKIKLRREGAKLGLLRQEKQRQHDQLEQHIATSLANTQKITAQADKLHQQVWTISQQLKRFQGYLLSPQQWLEGMAVQLQLLACALFVQQDLPSFQQGLLVLAEQLIDRYQEIDAGLLSTKGVGALRTGKFSIAGEVALGLIGVGAIEPAMALLNTLQQQHTEQAWLEVPSLLRLTAVQMALAQAQEPLVQLVQQYQYYPGLDGQMVQVCRGIVQRDRNLIERALIRLTHDSFAHWQQSPYPGLAIIQMSVLAAVRCVRLAGIKPPALGDTVPWQLWQLR